MQIEYKEITKENINDIVKMFTEKTTWNEKVLRDHIHLEAGSFSIVAIYVDTPVGLISTYTKDFTPPLTHLKDAYIDILEVGKDYQRRGIARTLINLTEKWAQENGFVQIRSWSSEDKTEAIPMWYALGYSMCPAKLWIEWCKEIIDGYYVVKKLNNNTHYSCSV